MKSFFKNLKKVNTRGWGGRLLAALILFALAGLSYLDAMYRGPVFTHCYPAFSIFMIRWLGRVSSLVPFSLLESGLTVLILGALANLGLAIKKRTGFLRWICTVLLVCAYLTCSFVVFWGVNHFGGDLYDTLGMTHTEYTKQDLYDAGLYCIEQANALAEKLPKNEDGSIAMPDFKTLQNQALEGFSAITEETPAIAMPANRPKALLYTPIYSYTGFTGFIFAFTGETCVSRNTYPSALPLTMTHELSHAIAVASEDEANFMGFLACLANSSPYYQYSAWYHGYMWCANSLYKIDREMGRDLVSHCSTAFGDDLRATNRHYEPYDGKVQETAQQVNNAYLQFYKEVGIEAYDRAVSYVVNWYLNGCPTFTQSQN